MIDPRGFVFDVLGLLLMGYALFVDQLRNVGILTSGIGLIVIGMTTSGRRDDEWENDR